MNILSDFFNWISTPQGTDTMIKIFGLIGVFVTLFYTHKRAQSMEKQIAATQEQLLLSKKSQVTDQFNKAIEQLAHEKKEVRIGGLYTLNRLTTEDPNLISNIQEIIISYIQNHYSAIPKLNQRIFQFGLLDDFFQIIPLPDGYRYASDLEKKIIEELHNEELLDNEGIIIKSPSLPIRKTSFDLYKIVKKVDVLGSGVDADDVLIYLLRANYFKLTEPQSDIRVAFEIITKLANNIKTVSHISNSNLHHIFLHGFSFINFNFSNSIFGSADLSFGRFIKCNMSNVIFQGAHLCCSTFEECDLDKADFQFIKTWAGGEKDYHDKAENYLANNRRICLKNSTLKYTNFRFSILINSDFSDTKHRNSQFGHSQIDNSDFSNAKLHDTQFGDTSAYNCKFVRANISGCSFNNTKLCGSDFSNCRSEPLSLKRDKQSPFPTRFQSADLENVIFDNAELYDVDLRETKNLTIDQLIKAKSLKGAKLDIELQQEIKNKHPHFFEDMVKQDVNL